MSTKPANKITAKEAYTLLQNAKNAAKEDQFWYRSVLKYDIDNCREGKWVNALLRPTPTGDWVRPVIKFDDEVHVGQIMPLDKKELLEVTSKMKFKNADAKEREGDPSLQIHRWNAQVPTEEDGFTVKRGEDGKELLPSDDKKSWYYAYAALADEAFQTEMNHLIETKQIGLKPRSMPGDAKKASGGPKRVVESIKVCRITQTEFSDKSKNSKIRGAPMPNPVTRLKLKFDKESGGTSKVDFKDCTKVITTTNQQGKKVQRYDTALVDGKPVNASNVHKFVLSGSKVGGLAETYVSFSNLGISQIHSVKVLMVSPPPARGATAEDFYDDENDAVVVAAAPADKDGDAKAVPPAASPAAAAAPAASASKAKAAAPAAKPAAAAAPAVKAPTPAETADEDDGLADI